jgi:uncharacterized protein YjiS (DUF1127 family)
MQMPLTRSRFVPRRAGLHTTLARVSARIAAWCERARQRRHLADLPDYLLKDLGLRRADVVCESGKPFWRA